MKRSFRVVALLLFLSASFSTNLSAQTAGEEMSLGVQAYKQAKYEAAVQHFKRCVELAPEITNAHLYLATAYAQQHIPGVETADNIRFAEQSIDQYQDALNGNPVYFGKDQQR